MEATERYRQVAALHAANIDQGFLATLGQPFLSLMYRAIDEAPDSVLIFDDAGGKVRGFVSGSAGMGSIYRRMMCRPVLLALALLPSLVQPSRLMRIIEILRYGGGEGPAELPPAELLSIAVDPAWRGRGVAESLYNRLSAHWATQGVQSFRITVGERLAPAHRFYERMGATPVGHVEVHAGERSVVYVQQTSRRTKVQQASRVSRPAP